jgi:hypothetical protein
MLVYAKDLITDLKYSMENDEEQTIEERDIKTIEWLIEQAKRAEMYRTSLIQIAENKVSPVFYAKSTLYETDQRFNKL